MYVATMVFAFLDSPAAKGLLVGSIFLTIVVPVFLHFIIRSADYYKRRQEEAFQEHERARAALKDMVGEASEDAEDLAEEAARDAEDTAGGVPAEEEPELPRH